MTKRTQAVLGLLAESAQLTALEIADKLQLATGNAVTASLVSICDQGLANRVAGAVRRYEVTARGREVWRTLQERP